MQYRLNLRQDKLVLGGVLVVIGIGIFFMYSAELFICFKWWMGIPLSFQESIRDCDTPTSLIGFMLAAASMFLPFAFGTWFLWKGVKEKPRHEMQA